MQQPGDICKKYVEPEYYEFAPQVIDTENYGRTLIYAPSVAFPNGTVRRPSHANDDTPVRIPRGCASGWDLASRSADMDDEGIDIMICFPQ